MRRSLRNGLFALSSVVLACCSSNPKPPPCGPVSQPWTPAPLAIASGQAPSASSTTGNETKAPSKPLYSIEQLLQVQRAFAPRALDAQSFVYLSDAPGTSQLFFHRGTDPDAQLTSFPDRVSSLRASPDGKRAVFLKDEGGNENFQIYAMEFGAAKP